MARIVMKFGGTSVADLDRIRNVARHVKREVDAGHEVAVVVSAMSGKTNELVGWMREAVAACTTRANTTPSSPPASRSRPGLLAIVLQSIRRPRPLLAGLADPDPDRQRAWRGAHRRTSMAPFLIKRFGEGQVAVIAGFQGIAPDNRIATLGRGGSDTSAVAIAAAVKADRCDIYTDVDGVYTTDPRIVPKARRLAKISFEEMLEMASLGAKVLQVRSVELAMVHRVRDLRALVLRRSRCARHGGFRQSARNAHLRRGRNRGTAGRHRHRLCQGRSADLAAPRRRPAGRRRRHLRPAGRGQHQCRHDRPEHLRGRHASPT